MKLLFTKVSCKNNLLISNFCMSLTSVILLILSVSCAVDTDKGIITSSNSTNDSIVITLSGVTNLSTTVPGQSVDYWFNNGISCELTCSKADKIYIAEKKEGSGDISYTDTSSIIYFKANYRYEIRTIKATLEEVSSSKNSLIYVFVEPGIKMGGKKGDEDFYDYPVNYY
ncbi:MAG: hypothetical protein A2015_17315 [Spirochaetes bacterium GWF1_31_7]|nr:MAG: hypothetical protein A2Y30_14605 [Spirochaetes bacterium GWE1_32_154]OHD46857.1 MAG: hypothetical protein A2015_17315 [Spirochaetes bacterium GWF1_31_7]OHD50185.1 MAG: hypothetical protein A2Y29_12650 [Spirochaetes bacterium GWE2_31_10]OHD81969.1 MAG: hypothetical protein A2355_02020 [Spirochaetes bacterium RIFOXYB1_FULL_32_8]HBD94035.1 hypothetical protein [Spirochaetia bacterium]